VVRLYLGAILPGRGWLLGFGRSEGRPTGQPGSPLGRARPSHQDRLHQGRERDGEEDPPEAPEPAEDQDGDDDRHRVQVDHLREQQGDQDVAVQGLDDEVGRSEPAELGAPAPLDPGNQEHGDGHQGGPDVGNDHREPDQDPQQHGVLEPEGVEGEVAGRPDDEDLPELAADVVGDLPIHIVPDGPGDAPVLGQIALGPIGDEVAILQEEKDQQGHQDQVDG
jgi:hypothetical protein